MPSLALYSPAVPPARSGQAIILHRLLAGFDPKNYLLIANDHYQKHKEQTATTTLGAAEALIHPVTAHPVPENRISDALRAPYYEAVEVYARAEQFAAIIRKHGVEVLLTCTGDHYDFVAGYFGARKAGARFIAYLFDDYLYQCPRYLRPLAFVWERLALRGAERVIVTNERFAELIKARHGVTADVIHNAADLPDISAPPGPSPFPAGELSIIFAGTIYNAHYDAFHNLIKALERFPDAKLRVFSFQGADDLAALGIGGPQVVVEPFRPQNEVLDAQRHADVLFLPLAFESPLKPLLRTSAPGKTAEYLTLGLPILVHAPADTFLSTYFRRHDCGYVVDSNDSAALAKGLEALFNDSAMTNRLIRNAQERAAEDFSITKAREAFASIVGAK